MRGGREANAAVIAWRRAEQSAQQSPSGCCEARAALPGTGTTHGRATQPSTEGPQGLTGGGRQVSLTAGPRSLLGKPAAEPGLPHAPAAPLECLQLLVCGRMGAGGAGTPLCPGAWGDPKGVLGSTVPSYQPWHGWEASRLAPASPPASSCLGTHTAPQLLPGWGTRCAAPSRGLRHPGGWKPPRLREGAQPHAQHLCCGGSGGPARPGAASRGRVAAPCSRWLGQAVPPATPGTAAGNSPGRGCPAGTATAPARLGGRQENDTPIGAAETTKNPTGGSWCHPSPHQPRAEGAVPVPGLRCWSGRYLTAGGF